MKRLFTMLVLTITFSCSKSQYFFYHLIKNGVTANVASNVKNIQSINNLAYESFGVPVQNKINQVTYYYSNATTHTTGGKLVYRKYNIAANVWSDYVVFQTDSIHINGCYGGKMDNDSTVLFSSRNHNDQYHTRDIYIQKVDSNNNFSAPVAFNWSGITELQGGFFFGPMITGDNVGQYSMMLYQSNSDTGSTRYRVSMIGTTDRWSHYSEIGVLYDGSALPFSETAGINLGSGKYLGLARLNNAGTLTPFESTDYGVTWTRRPQSNLNYYGGGAPEIPYIYGHDGVFDVFYESRDVSMMLISKGNTVAANFGNATPVYNDNEIYSYHRGTGTNPSLGYGSELKLSNGYFLTIYQKEFTNSRANIQWTVDDLATDPSGVPAVPTFVTRGITTTSFTIDSLNSLDNTILQNVRYFQIDLSTHADFSDFVTAKYRAISAYSASVIHDTKIPGYFVLFNSLTTGTTYYFRIKACNNAGCSAYTTTNVTTL
jgi:hypothetical protein